MKGICIFQQPIGHVQYILCQKICIHMYVCVCVKVDVCAHIKKHNDSMMGYTYVEICMLSNKNDSDTIFMEAPTNRNTNLTPPTPFPKFQPGAPCEQ